MYKQFVLGRDQDQRMYICRKFYLNPRECLMIQSTSDHKCLGLNHGDFLVYDGSHDKPYFPKEWEMWRNPYYFSEEYLEEQEGKERHQIYNGDKTREINFFLL